MSGLPDLIRLRGFHAAPLLLAMGPQTTGATSNPRPRPRITRSTRLRFTQSPFFRCSQQATRDSRGRAFSHRPRRSARRIADRPGFTLATAAACVAKTIDRAVGETVRWLSTRILI
jgi:hypothetical protein